MGNIVYGGNGQFVFANSPGSGAIRYLNTASIGVPNRPSGFDTDIAPFIIDAALMEGGNIVVRSVVGALGGTFSRWIGGKGAELANIEAQNIANAQRLANDLRLQSANSPFAVNGTLTQDAISSAKAVPGLGPGQLSNPAIPPGFGKYTTETFQSPAGNFQVHFYKNPTTGEVFYGLDYKAVFNNMSGVPKP